jgi:cellulose synthase/poly-beta-1,6-N-acetylglucosamine synthase-like glycosyltransferase
MDYAILIVISSAAFLLYVLFGYPIVLRLWPGTKRGRLQASVERPPERWPTVSVVMPVKNGERWLEAKLLTLLELDYPAEKLEVLVIDNGCDDRSAEIAQRYASRGVRLLKAAGGGKAGGLNEGLKHATGEILFMTDVRQRLDRQALKMLVACFDDPEVGVASGELMILKGDSEEEANVGLYWRYEKWIRQCHSDIDSVIGATGAIYAMRRSLAQPLPLYTLNDDVHLPLCAFFAGYRVLFVPESRAYDAPTALDAEFKRKVRTQAGVYELIGRFPGLMGPQNRMLVHFLSHKFGRLVLPWALVALLVASPFLPGPWNLLMLAGQGLFYGLALVDPWIPEASKLKKLTSVIRTFVVLMLAALVAVSRLWRTPESFWPRPTVMGRRA